MRTIGRRIPEDRPHGDFVSVCDYCGVPWYRSQLRRDGAGLLACPDEGDGPSATEQLERNAEKALAWAGKQADMSQRVYDGRPFEFVVDEIPVVDETPSDLVFGTLPAARAAWWPWERIVGTHTGATGHLIRSGDSTIYDMPVAQGIGSLVDEAECSALSAGATGAKRLRLNDLVDQSGNGHSLTQQSFDLPKFYDPALGGMLRLNGHPAAEFTGPENAAQFVGTAMRHGNNTGDPAQWDPSYLLGFEGNPAMTIAWMGNVLDDGVPGGLARYLFILGEFFGLGANKDHQGLGLSAVDPGHWQNLLNITLGPDSAPGTNDRHLRFELDGPWSEMQHIVLVRDAGARWDATRVYRNGRLQTPVRGYGHTNDQLTLGPSEYGATAIGANAYMQQFYKGYFLGAIVWDQAFAHGGDDLRMLFSELNARRAIAS